MKIKKLNFCATLSLAFLTLLPPSALAASFTPTNAVKGRGIDFLANVAANLFTDILKGALNMDELTPDTSLAETDFTSRNINTAYILIALADDAQDKKSFFGSANGEVVPQQTVDAKSTQYPGTNAEIGALISRGFFDSISVGSPPKTSLELNLQNFEPGPLSEERTTSAAFGFVFANGEFIFGGQEKSRKIPENPVLIPEPSSTLSLLALGTLGAASTLKRKLKKSRQN